MWNFILIVVHIKSNLHKTVRSNWNVRIQRYNSSKMEPLRIVKVFDLRFASDDDTPMHTRWCNRFILFVNLASLAHAHSSSINFIFMMMDTDLESALFGVFQVAATFSAFYTALITSLFPESIDNFFIKLNDIRGNGKF